MITFIIPSKGRTTLANTLISLYNQSCNNWNAVVCFDAVEATMQETRQIEVVHSKEKLGIGVNGAGEVRNHAIQKAKRLSEWIGFVDDDDILNYQYVYDLEYILRSIPLYEGVRPDVVIFRMKCTDNNILPPLEADPPINGKFLQSIAEYENKVGISFAINTEVFKRLKFNPSSGEDFDVLKRAFDAGYYIYLSNLVNYFVSPLGCAVDRRK